MEPTIFTDIFTDIATADRDSECWGGSEQEYSDR